MKLNKNLALFLVTVSQFTVLLPTIRVVCTAALSDSYFEFRKKQYVESFEFLNKLGYKDFFIVESLKRGGPTFLESYSKNVFYATVNDSSLKNHGINEAKTLLECCEHFNFQPDDIVIKLTGRHRVTSDYFLKIVENNQDFDAWVKVNSDGNVFTVGFAMKYKYLKEMFKSIDYAYINSTMTPIEYKVGDYIKSKKNNNLFKVYYLDKLDIVANILGSTTAPGCPEEVIIF